MNLDEINEYANPGHEFLVQNSPFVVNGRLTITLEGSEFNYWLLADDGRMLSLNPDADEIIVFSPVSDELSGDDEAVVLQGKEYEFTYEDGGMISDLEGETDLDLEDEINFKDYEAEDGEKVRSATIMPSGDKYNYIGQVALDDDIKKG
jgi:hypothetical protein